MDRCPVGNRRVVLPVVYEQGRSCGTLVSSFSALFLSSFFSFLLFSSLQVSSLFLRVLPLQLCRGSTILQRFVVNRYFVSEKISVLTFLVCCARHRRFTVNLRHLNSRQGWLLLVCFSFCLLKYRWKRYHLAENIPTYGYQRSLLEIIRIDTTISPKCIEARRACS